ncbi:MAG: DUF543 domain-containing protein [Rhodocyclaceae bacterium]|nr:MAG: DUF543 domain-containing protein [Rhodocyclaceae bacterium]
MPSRVSRSKGACSMSTTAKSRPLRPRISTTWGDGVLMNVPFTKPAVFMRGRGMVMLLSVGVGVGAAYTEGMNCRQWSPSLWGLGGALALSAARPIRSATLRSRALR